MFKYLKVYFFRKNKKVYYINLFLFQGSLFGVLRMFQTKSSVFVSCNIISVHIHINTCSLLFFIPTHIQVFQLFLFTQH